MPKVQPTASTLETRGDVTRPVTLVEIRAALAEIMQKSTPAQQGGVSLQSLMHIFKDAVSEQNQLHDAVTIEKNFHDIGFDHVREIAIPYIHKELASISAVIAYAVNHIAQLSEALAELSKHAPQALKQPLTEISTRIFETCGFQDVVGQRLATITSLIKEVGAIQHGIKAMLGDTEAQSAYLDHRSTQPSDLVKELKTENKPDRNSQTEIDKLFSS